MRTLRGTLATRGILIAIGALIAIAASAVTAVAVRAGAAGGAAASQAAVGAGSVAGPRDTVKPGIDTLSAAYAIGYLAAVHPAGRQRADRGPAGGSGATD